MEVRQSFTYKNAEFHNAPRLQTRGDRSEFLGILSDPYPLEGCPVAIHVLKAKSVKG